MFLTTQNKVEDLCLEINLVFQSGCLLFSTSNKSEKLFENNFLQEFLPFFEV